MHITDNKILFLFLLKKETFSPQKDIVHEMRTDFKRVVVLFYMMVQCNESDLLVLAKPFPKIPTNHLKQKEK